MNRPAIKTEGHLRHERRPRRLGPLVVASMLLLCLAPPLRAQENVAPGIDFAGLAEGLGRVVSPPAVPRTGQESLPTPAPEHFIPVRSDVDAGAIQVDNRDGMVRLMVRNAPLRQVLALLAESQKLNLVFASVSEATVTVSLDRVPLSTALDAILSSCGHTWAMRDNIIHVTQIAEGVAVAPGAQGRRMEVFELDYASAADVDLAVKGLLSPIGKSWITQSSPTDNRRTREMIIVEDLPEYIDRIAAYILQSDQPPRQVLVEVSILQVDLDDDRACGVNFHKLGDLSGTGIRFSTTGFDTNPPTSSPNLGESFFFSVQGGDMSALVRLLHETNDAKTLASPKLLAVNGQESEIIIGKELPYRETTNSPSNVTQETVKFLPVGVKLRITPWISRDGRILMRVLPEVSDGVLNQQGLPETAKTEVATDVFLADGQGIVIGGLIRENDSVNQAKVPFIGDIPYAGAFFQRREAKRSRSEVIVALMPHLLPYAPDIECQNAVEVQRARDPLVYGPLCRYPRPYEPRLPDVAHDAFSGWHARLDEAREAFNEYQATRAPGSGLFIRRLPNSPEQDAMHPAWDQPDCGAPETLHEQLELAMPDGPMYR